MEWNELHTLLLTKPTLSEQRDVLPYFKSRPNLSLLLGTYASRMMRPNCLAYEYILDGDFRADLIVGDSSARNYLLVEFEDGTPDGVFTKKRHKRTPDWSARFERAHSQVVDWLWKLDDLRHTATFAATFGGRDARFEGFIVIGKGMNLASQEQQRLQWRNRRTIIDSSPLCSVSFEELERDIGNWLTFNKF